ncbi:MAG TPA: Gfo/Idh/MocA family oxidoreductase [Polyangiaceae bacterium]|jgi:predicted dehydrogenase
MSNMTIGIIGCGNIAPAYLRGAQKSDVVRVKACADVLAEAARARASEFGCEAMSVEQLLGDREIELVVNLTIPRAHFEIAMQILGAGKHVYNEKPLSVTVEDGKRLLDAAAPRGLRVGCAPDTFLGAGMQTCRRVFDDGVIGTAIGGNMCMAWLGPESWHPNPAFFYDVGGGPLLDMGPYYVTALVNLLGPVQRVSAFTSRPRKERVATSEARYGEKIPVRVDTHNTGLVEFAGGASITATFSWDVAHTQMPRLVIFGSEGTLEMPDPNGFVGPVNIRRHGGEDWSEQPLLHAENARMFGVVDMAAAIRQGRPHRASGELALHVLEVLEAFGRSSAAEKPVLIQNGCLRPAPLPIGLTAWAID